MCSACDAFLNGLRWTEEERAKKKKKRRKEKEKRERETDKDLVSSAKLRLVAHSPTRLLSSYLPVWLLLTHQVWVQSLNTTSQQSHTLTQIPKQPTAAPPPLLRLSPHWLALLPLPGLQCCQIGLFGDLSVSLSGWKQEPWLVITRREVGVESGGGWRELIHSTRMGTNSPPCMYYTRTYSHMNGATFKCTASV